MRKTGISSGTTSSWLGRGVPVSKLSLGKLALPGSEFSAGPEPEILGTELFVFRVLAKMAFPFLSVKVLMEF